MDLLGKPLTELKELLTKKAISQKELFLYFKNRIETYDKTINAYVTLVPQQEAKGEGALTGVPISIKDNFCTKNIRTTASSKVLDTFIPPYSATVTQKLEQAGVVWLGKTNMDAWAHGSSTETSDYGTTKTPWDVERVAGGSSGGSAASVAAYLAPASIGSETAGSIRQPAAWCGVVGLKPTYGRVSRYGVVAMGSSLDCPGPITLNVADAALLLEIIAGKDPFDATSSSAPVEPYTKNLAEKKKFVIGVCEDYLEGVSADILKAFSETKAILTKMGHTLKPIKLLPPKYSISTYTIIQRSEVSSNLNRYDGVRYGNGREYFGAEAKRRIMLGTYALSAGYQDEYYKKAVKVRALIIEDFKKAFTEVDVILAPTTPVTALKVGESEKYPFFGEVMDVLLEPAAMAGIPAISFPVGLDGNGLPIGMQFMGNYFKEADILNLAKQYEDKTGFGGVIQTGLKKYK